MELQSKADIQALLDSDDPNSLFIDPILDSSQIGNVTIDLRLGYDFMVSILTRSPVVRIGRKAHDKVRSIGSHFQPTRRDLGDKFVLYPHQVVLATTLEYFSLPDDIYADVLSRSSYTRLGIHLNTMVQPGFRGAIPLELFNHSNNAIELVVGSRVVQTRLFKINSATDYGNDGARKYYGNIRPAISKADDDEDMASLLSL